MTRYAMALDTHACIGCLACTVACKVENGNPEGIWFAPVLGQDFGTFPDVRRAYVPLLCNHCADAPCLRACPTSAISRRADGIVLIDQDRCCGTGACAIACPYGAIHLYGKREAPQTPFDQVKVAAHQPGTAQKCTFCAPRLDQGLEPACIGVCPTGARIFGDLDDPESRVARAFAAPDAVKLGSPVDTRPGTRYLARGVRHAGGSDADIALASRPQTLWGLFHALEFWLFGMAAGVAVVSRVRPVQLGVGEGRLDLGALLALLFMLAGGLILIAHLGRPLRFPQALRNWRTSWISRGAIADFVLVFLLAVLVAAEPSAIRAVAAMVAVPVALVVAIYPAMVMGDLPSVRAWHRTGLAWTFLVEALLAGVGVTGVVGGWTHGLLLALATLAAVRLALALRRRETEPSRAIAAAALVVIAALAGLAVPSVAPLAGAVAAAVAVAFSLLAKRAALRAGRSPSPFGAEGEPRGLARAGG
jgi:molybdopterin-containing oxidoreductase family iron-sulfur binding subunit